MQTDQPMLSLTTNSTRRVFFTAGKVVTSVAARSVIGVVILATCRSAATGQDWARDGATTQRHAVSAAELLPPSFEYVQSSPETSIGGKSIARGVADPSGLLPPASAPGDGQTSKLEPLPLGELEANPLRPYSAPGFPQMQPAVPPAHRVIRAPRPPQKPSPIDTLMGIRTSPRPQSPAGFQQTVDGAVVIPDQVIVPGGTPIDQHGTHWGGTVASDHYRAGPLQSDLRESYHPPHSDMRRRFMPPQATIPQARQSPTWKTPYSYGYFGASGKRHWSLHHGNRDRATTWNLW